MLCRHYAVGRQRAFSARIGGCGTVAHAGRWISFAALGGLIALCGSTVFLYTGDRNAAWVASLAAASSSLLGSWGTIGQVDILAAFFALAAFYWYSRFHVQGEATL